MPKALPTFVEIDLKKGKEHEHPDIQEGARHKYLAYVCGDWYFGSFFREHYGLTFDCNFGVGGSIQFDTPGYNSSDWRRLLKIEGLKVR